MKKHDHEMSENFQLTPFGVSNNIVSYLTTIDSHPV